MDRVADLRAFPHADLYKSIVDTMVQLSFLLVHGEMGREPGIWIEEHSSIAGEVQRC